jgi:hypothetical protein
MGSTLIVSSGDTVKIKKDASMFGELVIDRGATSGNNRHFILYGVLEIEDVTLTGAYCSDSGGSVLIEANGASGTFRRIHFKGNTGSDIGGGAAIIYNSGSGTFISCSWSGNTVVAGIGDDLNIASTAGSITIINSESAMDIAGDSTKIVACSAENSPCTTTGKICSVASLPLVGVLCNYPACPTIYKVGDTQVQGTDGWNVWSASCAMGVTYEFTSGTVKIKKDPSMPSELVIDRGGHTSLTQVNRHFNVKGGALEMKDVTLTGGYTYFVSLFFLLLSIFILLRWCSSICIV